MARTYQDAADRWAGVGPYYAMFPVAFADDVVRTYTQPGGVVLDPFAGRGTAVFSAATQDRLGIGIEINPVGYVYAKAKLSPGSQKLVELRLVELAKGAGQFQRDMEDLPRFFHRCFSPRVCMFLLSARRDLNWRQSKVDCTVMALLLVYLHGKTGAALSNQLRQTKSMSPQYAVRWWDERKLDPPDIDPVAFLKKRLDWRYAKGIPATRSGIMYLGNSVEKLEALRRRIAKTSLSKSNLLFTSPPYHGITNYHYDQWLRLWLLGNPPNALRNGNGRSGKFEAREEYASLLEQVFSRAARLLQHDATIYVRTDSREFTYRTTLEVLHKVFPDKYMTEIRRPLLGPSQTRLFGKASTPTDKNGEVDLILRA
jgi:DNA methylase